MLSRRDVLKRSAHWAATLALPAIARAADTDSVEVNDVQSQLNATRVNRVVTPASVDELRSVLRDAKRSGKSVCVAGGRHAMGGQQFAADGVLIDTAKFNRVVEFDPIKGLVTAEAGIEWPELIDHLNRAQMGRPHPWGVREKQTGVDRVSLGGSLSSNIHGRGLRFPPMIGDIDSFTLLDAGGELRTCSRRENPELFSLGVGGYGLFGLVAHVTLRLAPRTKIQRVVEVIAVKDLLPGVEGRVKDGFLYGDCQYSTDLLGEAPAHAGVFSCYKPVPTETLIPEDQRQLSRADWAELYGLARTDKKKAFEKYSQYYLTTTGQVYWSDTHQLAGNFDGYRRAVEKVRGTEMITEVYVRPDNFVPFMAQARKDFVEHGVDMTYGTIRFIEKDAETFLPWAKEPSVCIVCNLHVMHTEEGKRKAAEDFRRIIDRAIQFGGRYFLTYHRWATRPQVETCYPQFVDFLRLKKKYDSGESFQSNWYRHYKQMFADKL